DLFRQSLKTEVPLRDTVMTYIVQRKGKQIRPLFVMYAAKLNGEVSERTYRGAALVELLHTATLVHDDVVDDSDQRRGFFSINALWKNKIAVLVGDYLLSRGLLLSIDHDDFNLLKIVSSAVREMSEGELLQIEKARRLYITEDIYYDVIRKKTASLIASCCAVGAASVGASEEVIEKFRLFGEKVGMAFQIKDDLLDFGDADIGKPHGIDIKEKKMTLPLIYMLNKSDKSTKRFVINAIKNDHDNPKKVDEIIKMVVASGGIEYASGVMTKLKNEALDLIKDYQSHENYIHFSSLVDFIIEREK
ncbi:MAG: polyprenyl synthetase family protein, partial [Bacteroidetes bacterium]|nr:polyprenyl synthetase family protein [Bacteroidota bacterium]